MSKQEAILFIKTQLEKTNMIRELHDELRKELIETVYESMAYYEYDINERTVQLYMLGIMDGMIYQLRKIMEK